jgi:tetratricopeptide (TPR) repeat protein/tRNA A-37 threonylcarbamoyl transferase component Bud32
MLEGTLERAMIAIIETHVDRCEQCASVVAGLGALAPASRVEPDHHELAAIDPEHYALGDELARGGMGRILRARDRRLHREIAIKENFVKTGDSARRFEREARITARLQHPSIVQVHEAGVWSTGEPFFAMQLVRGRSLDEVIADATTLPRRLALVPNVLAVADAMAYAHSEGVIHRDLKPKNVIVGNFGETVVIDWGLAKDLSANVPDIDAGPYRAAGNADDQTEHGQVIGTPSYMPPEQALGEAVDARADVYALGALLFHVLAGRSPVSGKSSQEVLATIVAGGAASLEDVQPDVPPDLLAIVAKAMAFAPADRYPSARELAEDLRQFQTGQLVSAHRYSLGQLARRWLRRHRGAVTVALAATAVLVAGGVVSVRGIMHAEVAAEAARDTADHNRADAEDLMSFMLGDLRDKLEPLGKLDLLDSVAKKATTYYARPATDGTDGGERAVASVRLGEVQLAQGHTTEALADFRSALAITEALVVVDPANERWQRNLGIQHMRVGDALVAQGDPAGALLEYRADVAITEQLVARAPTDVMRQRDVSVSHERLGNILDGQGHTADAIAEYRASLAMSEQILAIAPTDNHERDVAIGHEKIGETLGEHGDQAAALVELRAAQVIDKRLAARDDTNTMWQLDLALNHGQIGQALAFEDKLPDALAEYRAALAIEDRLVTRDPSNADWQSELAARHGDIAKMLRKQGARSGLPTALAEYRAALVIQDRLAAQDPTRAERQHDVAYSHQGIGEVLELLGDRKHALAEYRTELDLASPLVARDANNAAWQRDLAMAHEKIGRLVEIDGDLDAAIEHDRSCLDIRAKLSATDPSNSPWLDDVAVSHYNLAEVLAKRDVAAALVEHRAALAITETLLAREPKVTTRRHDLADSHEEIGRLLRRQHDSGASAELAAALAIYDSNAEWRDDAAKLRADL